MQPFRSATAYKQALNEKTIASIWEVSERCDYDKTELETAYKHKIMAEYWKKWGIKDEPLKVLQTSESTTDMTAANGDVWHF